MEDLRKQEIVGVYNRAAPTYNQVGIQQFTYFAERLVEQLTIPLGAQVLDVATGRGPLLFALAQKIGESGHILGIDLAPAMVQATAAEIQTRQLRQAEVKLMDADEAAFPDHSLDVIVCGFALQFLNYEHNLPRFRKMLKPGGVFAASISYVPVQQRENLERWQWLFDLTRAVFPPGFVPPASWTAPNQLNRPELIEAALRKAGFSAITTRAEEATFYFADEEDWWAWEWSQASRFWLEGMSAEGLAQFKTTAFEKLAAMQTPKGIPIVDGALFAIAQAPA